MSVHSLHSRERGFTIIELMIATLVFSVILTVITVGVVSFTNSYYRGVNNSTTQNTARTILDTISQAIQFGSAPVTPTTAAGDYFCAGGYHFKYDNSGALYTGTQTGLYMAPMSGVCTVASPPGGTQLLGKNLRLTNLEVKQLIAGGNLYSVTISIAMGADDLLCSLSQPGSCGGGAMTFWPVTDVQCRSTVGSQFCATSTLTTVVEQRIGT
jgi:prepilin-type N-terminal cleavage/methylation domain-containing protein